MQVLKSSSVFSTSHFLNFSLKPKAVIFLLYYSSSSSSPCSSSSSTSVSNSPLFNYLVKNLDFTETQALSIASRYPNVKSFEKPQSVANFFRNLGFSNAQIAASVRNAPQILFANLIPSIQIVKRVLGNNDNKDLIKVFDRSNGFIASGRILKLSRNIEYLESCGIVGSQLSRLLRRQPRIFRMRESALRDLVSRVLDMGFSTDSRMLVHAVHTMNRLSEQTLKKKWELLKSFGFSENDCLDMFRKAPGLFRPSEEKMKLGIVFFMSIAKVDRNVLVSRPHLWMNSLEDRVIPRYRVWQIIKLKKLLKKEPSFLNLLDYKEREFLQFISSFTDDVEELLMAYKAHLLHTSEEEEET
ncbi:Transcription termination factor [Theobroma cacao]|nr:Transcription termination factor [Theobroma cacao]